MHRGAVRKDVRKERRREGWTLDAVWEAVDREKWGTIRQVEPWQRKCNGT